MKSKEVWKPIDGYDNLYEVSDMGSVRNRLTGEVLKQYPNNKGKYLATPLTKNGKRALVRVHRLVAIAHIDNAEGHKLVLHKDDNGNNNTVTNLYWGSKSNNTYDAIRNGKHPHANKTHCKRGHEYTEDNTKKTRDGRACRKCIRLLDLKKKEDY